MKKTALTMTDSERLGPSGTDKADAPSEFHKTPQEENDELKRVIEQQEIALDMIMRKYREHVDSLTKSSHFDVGNLYYKRFLNTIISQANKMDDMTKMMRKNLLVIFKYEELMNKIESENEDLRDQVRRLTLGVKMTEKRKALTTDTECQTGSVENLTMTRSVGTECNIVRQDQVPEKQDKSTDMISFPNDQACSWATNEHCGLLKPLNVDAALDLYVNRFAKENNTSVDLQAITKDKLEELSDVVSTTTDLLTEADELSSDISVVSLTEDTCSKQDFADVLSTSL